MREVSFAVLGPKADGEEVRDYTNRSTRFFYRVGNWPGIGMTKQDRNNALVYFATGKGEAPAYGVLRYLIEHDFLESDGATLTDKGQQIVNADGRR